MIRHTGRMPGMSSMMMGDINAHVGVYYMTNASDDRFQDIADVTIALLRGEPYPPAERRVIQVDPILLDRYVGIYEMGNDVFTVTRDGRSLFLQKNKNPKKGELLAENPAMFFLRGDPSTVTFEADSDGEIDRMVVTRRLDHLRCKETQIVGQPEHLVVNLCLCAAKYDHGRTRDFLPSVPPAS